MAQPIEIVLKEDIKKLGTAGSVMRVRPGFARNYLIPRGMAVIASASNLRQVEHEKIEAKKKAVKLAEQAQEAASKLSETVVEIARPAGEDGRLFGAVTAKDIAEALVRQGFAVDKKQVELPSPIKTVGEQTCTVHLTNQHVAEIKVVVSAQSSKRS